MASGVRLEEVASFRVKGKHDYWAGLPGGRFATATKRGVVQVWTTAGDLLATLEGHTGAIYALVCTPSGDIVSGSADSTARVWRDYACVHTLRGHSNWVFSVAVSPLDGAIATGSFDNTAKVWSASTGECVATLEGHFRPVTAVCVLDNGDIVTGSNDRTVWLWERGSWTCTAVYEESLQVSCMAVLSGGGLIVGGGDNRTTGFVSVWRGGRRERSLPVADVVVHVAEVQGFIVTCHTKSVKVFFDGECVKEWQANYPRITVLSNSSFTVASKKLGSTCDVYVVGRPSRMATIHVMITAWSLHGGVPPPASDSQSAVAALARTLSLRRLCRPRGGGADGSAEVTEPFGRDVVGYM